MNKDKVVYKKNTVNKRYKVNKVINNKKRPRWIMILIMGLIRVQTVRAPVGREELPSDSEAAQGKDPRLGRLLW